MAVVYDLFVKVFVFFFAICTFNLLVLFSAWDELKAQL